MEITGNTILITGGTSGIGLAFAEEFLRSGNKVIICGRRQNRFAQIEEKNPGIVTYLSDVADSKDREALADQVISNYPDVNVLINNAGVQLLTDLTKPVNLTRVNSEVETNFIAPIHLSSLFAQHFAKKKKLQSLISHQVWLLCHCLLCLCIVLPKQPFIRLLYH